jgi:hypothetical protein
MTKWRLTLRSFIVFIVIPIVIAYLLQQLFPMYLLSRIIAGLFAISSIVLAILPFVELIDIRSHPQQHSQQPVPRKRFQLPTLSQLRLMRTLWPLSRSHSSRCLHWLPNLARSNYCYLSRVSFSISSNYHHDRNYQHRCGGLVTR